MRAIQPDDLKLREQAKAHMLKVFYPYAPIPKALGLTRKDCDKTKTYLDQEIDDHLVSGLSLIGTAKSDPEDVALVLLVRVWKRDWNYDVLGSTMRGWHDAAAQLAAEHHDPSERHLVWRRYQTEHLFDMAQRILQTMVPDRIDRVIYLSMMGISQPKASSSSDVKQATWQLLPTYTNMIDFRNKVQVMQSTVDVMDHIADRVMNKPLLLDQMKYDQENLELEPGVKCFEPVTKFGGNRFFLDLDYYKRFQLWALFQASGRNFC